MSDPNVGHELMRRLTTRNPTLLGTSPNMIFHLHTVCIPVRTDETAYSHWTRISIKGTKAGIRYKWETVSARPKS
ncbi:hypothetical protein PIB30_094194, partial [Stylosanthes scabra]|nr:hypothetical protein [Stylosanthes scabra]